MGELGATSPAGRQPDDSLIGDSGAMRAVRRKIVAAARFDEPVLILGESGTGKELVARAVHAAHRHADQPLRVVNCAVLGGEILAAELFGHRAGAFTGARHDRRGRLTAAAGTSLLLDELSEAPETVQLALLRAIEVGEVQPIGADDTETVRDVRYMATSNRNPRDLISDDGLRADLFHRLATFVIHVPALRDRRDDIAPLVEHFLERLASRYGRQRSLADGAYGLLHEHDFPGNVRELRQIVFRAYAACEGQVISPLGVEQAILATAAFTTDRGPLTDRPSDGPLPLQEVIRAHIRRMVAMADFNLAHAARLMEIPRSTLQHYLSKYDIDTDELRADCRRRASR